MELVIADRAYGKHPLAGSAEWMLLHKALACVNYVAVDIGQILRLRLSFDQWLKHKEPLEQAGFVLVWPPTKGEAGPIQPPKGAITVAGLLRLGRYARGLERRASSVAKPLFDHVSFIRKTEGAQDEKK